MRCLMPSFLSVWVLMISLITRAGDAAAAEQWPSVTAPPMVQLGPGTTSWCVLQLAPETNDSVICYQLSLLRLCRACPSFTTKLPHHLINNPLLHLFFFFFCLGNIPLLSLNSSTESWTFRSVFTGPCLLPVAGSFILSAESTPGLHGELLSSVSSSPGR